MAVYNDRDRYIPYRRQDIVDMLLQEGRLTNAQDKAQFVTFCHILQSVFHHEFQQKLDGLKDNYYPINPDVDRCRKFSEEELVQTSNRLSEVFLEVLNDANFEEIPLEEINKTLDESGSLVNMKLRVDLNDLEDFHFFRRGEHMTKIKIKKKWFGLLSEDAEIKVCDRVVLFARFKPASYFSKKRRKNLLFQPGSTIIKIFKDIPADDLNMLFPNIQVVMQAKDKLMLGIPALVAGVPILLKSLPAMMVLASILGAIIGFKSGRSSEPNLKEALLVVSGLAALIGFVFKQLIVYKNKRIRFQKQIGDNLYFRNLDNNTGVFHYLIDMAEEEECKEAFLAYFFLLTTTEVKLNKARLDDLIEHWLEKKYDCEIDFEIEDALDKLVRYKLVFQDAEGTLSVPPLPEALRQVDEIWDNYFQYNV